MSIDLLSNMLSSLKNAAMAGRPNIETPYSSVCEAVAKVLAQKGFLTEVKIFKPEGKPYKMLNLVLAKEGNKALITDVKRVSKPGSRVYSSSYKIKTLRGYGVSVVSTSRGIIDGLEAKKKKLGGEILCEVF